MALKKILNKLYKYLKKSKAIHVQFWTGCEVPGG
jgi:hypothetical protein